VRNAFFCSEHPRRMLLFTRAWHIWGGCRKDKWGWERERIASGDRLFSSKAEERGGGWGGGDGGGDSGGGGGGGGVPIDCEDER
jgi:hypothetical protein